MREISENGKNCEKLLNYTRNVGYQKKGIDPLNSEKVILAVSDILYGQNGEKQQNRAKNARMTPVMTPSKLMTVKHGISYVKKTLVAGHQALRVLWRRLRHKTRYSWCKEYWRSITHY